VSRSAGSPFTHTLQVGINAEKWSPNLSHAASMTWPTVVPSIMIERSPAAASRTEANSRSVAISAMLAKGTVRDRSCPVCLFIVESAAVR
jgi:hypothetical protein